LKIASTPVADPQQNTDALTTLPAQTEFAKFRDVVYNNQPAIHLK